MIEITDVHLYQENGKLEIYSAKIKGSGIPEMRLEKIPTSDEIIRLIELAVLEAVKTQISEKHDVLLLADKEISERYNINKI
jgi:hypothetical protein